MDKKFLLRTVAILAILASGSAKALPVSDSVSAGVVSIEETLGKTNIHQNSDKAIIDWKNFDVALDEHVQFYQPSSSSITLNRIHDTKASLIEGTLTANGHIMLMNQNGLMFGNGAVVDVGSLTVTTADIDNADFMAGNYQFFSGNNDQARIVNDGSISVKEAGLVNLVAPHVENNGLIYAKMGKIQMAAADAFTLDLAGDGLIHIELSESDTQKIVRNSGKLQADGGYIAMTASKTRNIVDSLVDSSGVIEATSMTSVGGKIVLSSDGGLTKVSGKIDASGKDGGGEILIGGDYQGQGNIVTSSKTEITKTAELSANAIEKGDGGKVIVWADDSTVFAGAISVDAALVGDGGFVETSGKNTLNVKESAFVSAFAAGDGFAGAWLLDPRNVILSSAAGTDASAGGTIDATTDDEIIQISTIETALNNGINTIITTGSTGAQDGDITLQDALSWSGTGSLTLDAANDIILNNTITSTDQNADLTLNAGNDVFINNTIDTFDDLVMASYGAYADLTINAGNDVNINGVLDLYGDLNVTATAGTITIASNIDTNSGDMTLNSQTVFTSNTTINLFDSSRVKVNDLGGSASEYYAQYGALNTPSAGMDIGANTVSFKTGDYSIMGNVSGVGGTLRLYNVAANSSRMSVGDGITPLSNHISSAELDFIQPGFNEVFLDTAKIGGRTWNNNMQFFGNVQTMDFYGVHDFQNFDVKILTRDMLTVHDSLNGTGNLIIEANSATPLILGDNAIATYGQGASHTRLNVSDASINNIGDDWASLTYRSRTNIYHNLSSAHTYGMPVGFFTGSTYIESDLIAAAGSDGAFTFDIYSNPASPHVYLGADIITDGGDIVIEDTVLGATLNSDVVLNAKTGTVTIGTSGITGGNYDIEIIGATPVVKSAVTTTGDVTLRPYDDATSIGIGSGAGAFSVSDALLSNFTGQTTLMIGHDTSTGTVTIDNADMSGGGYDVQLYGGDFVIDNGFDTGDSVFIKAAGDITLNSAVSSTGSGNSIVLVVGDEFINNHGALALDPGSGRFLVYVSEEAKTTENGLIASSVYSSTYDSNPPASIAGTDNNFIYAEAEPAPPVVDNGGGEEVSQEQKEVSVIVSKQVNNITTAQPFNQKTISSSYGFLSEKAMPVSVDDANLVEAEEPVVDFYDLCLYNETYCH